MGWLLAAVGLGVVSVLLVPLSLLLTFLVPLIIASHVVLAVRLARTAAPR